MTINPLSDFSFTAFSWPEVFCFKMFPLMFFFFYFIFLYNAKEFLFCLSAFGSTSHYCFSEYLLQTPASIKKVEIFKFDTFAFALVVVYHTNVATHLLFLSYPFTC